VKSLATYQKLRGGYYTPKPIANFLASWAIQSSTNKILEPSCGDGILLEAAIEVLTRCGASPTEIAHLIYGVEIDPLEARKAAERIRVLACPEAQVHIHNGDFFAYCKTHLTDKHLFDAVIGNPPFIRYQNFPEEHRSMAFYLMQRAGLHPNRLTNSWVPFLVASTLLLNETGRLAMVIPAELLQVNYAAELRYFLSRYYKRLTLLTFRKLVFEGIQQEIVLLLGERDGTEHAGIQTFELEGIDDLALYEHTAPNGNVKEMDHSTEKWTMYFLEEEELQLLRRLRADLRISIARDIIDVDVGVVTGLNEFFVLTEQQVNAYALKQYTQPIVGRSFQLQGLTFSRADWIASVERQLPGFFLNVPDVPFSSLPEELQRYIKGGEDRGFHKGYKCRIRNHWYVVPSVWIPHAFMLRQVHNYPKIILNDAMATCTDTIHRVRLRTGASDRVIAAAFLNSLTFAFSEVIGRSYGGGVLELEPNEAERLPLPLIGADVLDVTEIDRLLREGNISAVLDITDEVLLKEGLSLCTEEIKMLRTIWQKLRDRRVNRNHSSSSRSN
jgi:adenine-specific DNA-methyltransferase